MCILKPWYCLVFIDQRSDRPAWVLCIHFDCINSNNTVNCVLPLLCICDTIKKPDCNNKNARLQHCIVLWFMNDSTLLGSKTTVFPWLCSISVSICFYHTVQGATIDSNVRRKKNMINMVTQYGDQAATMRMWKLVIICDKARDAYIPAFFSFSLSGCFGFPDSSSALRALIALLCFGSRDWAFFSKKYCKKTQRSPAAQQQMADEQKYLLVEKLLAAMEPDFSQRVMLTKPRSERMVNIKYTFVRQSEVDSK